MPASSVRRRPLLALLVSLTAAALVAAMIPGTPASAQSSEPSVNILRADWFTNYSGTFVNIEAKADVDDPDVADDLEVLAHVGDQTFELNDFEDADVYLYHRTSSPEPIDSVPATVTVEVVGGGSDTEPLVEWIPGAATGETDDRGRPYQEGFVSEYLDAYQITWKIEELAAEFPQLTEIIELPYETNGYRRRAQALVGDDIRFFLTTEAWGHEGGNDWSIETVDPGAADSPLTVSVDGTAITVSLGTDGDGGLASTVTEVVDALNAAPGLDGVMTAYVYRDDDEEDQPIAEVDSEQFSDFLSAPDHVERGPFTVKALRIKSDRGHGDKLGVIGYSQEHAREWQTPLVTLETAERLLRNYRTDAETRRLVDGLDIFLVPTVNPDGTNYSIYDYNFQRKNMTNYCTDPEDLDPNRRNQWGVDLNRNHSIGSAFEGYDGASTTNCRSGTFAGPEIHSEPEARNLIWLIETYDHIKFAMNIHSHGGYFMWSPAAYIEDGRIPLARPTLGVEDYYWYASERILGAIKEHRGTVIHPGRTGPVIDVLYSAAGNSGDELFYFDEDNPEPDIIAWDFEVGAQIWDPEDQDWDSQGFQPDISEGVDQALEFSNGLIELFQVALDYANDRRAPNTDLVVVGSGDGMVEFTFESSEAATVYYTTDGSRPDYDSAILEAEYLRDDAETITVPVGTQVNWFSVDIKGNVERSYDPDSSRGRTYQFERVRP